MDFVIVLEKSAVNSNSVLRHRNKNLFLESFYSYLVVLTPFYPTTHFEAVMAEREQEQIPKFISTGVEVEDPKKVSITQKITSGLYVSDSEFDWLINHLKRRVVAKELALEEGKSVYAREMKK